MNTPFVAAAQRHEAELAAFAELAVPPVADMVPDDLSADGFEGFEDEPDPVVVLAEDAKTTALIQEVFVALSDCDLRRDGYHWPHARWLGEFSRVPLFPIARALVNHVRKPRHLHHAIPSFFPALEPFHHAHLIETLEPLLCEDAA